MLKDYRDLEISGASPAARDAFERALALHLSWRTGADLHLEQALREAPQFTMAHVLRGYLSLCSRDVTRVRESRTAHQAAAALAVTPREQLHVATMRAVLADDFDAVRMLLDKLLRDFPHDVLAAQIGHSFDYLTGDIDGMASRISSLLPAWSPELPGYHAMLAMQAFSLVESGHYGPALDYGAGALELDAYDARAHHALTHLYEMTGNAADGERWMRARRPFWSYDTVAATHLWWHWALFYLAQGEVGAALALYDQEVRKSRSGDVADLIDAAALLWRVELLGGAAGERWRELAAAWAPHIDDGYCTFVDLHALVAQVGAKDWKTALHLESELRRRQTLATRYGETTRRVGLPAARAIIAFGRRDYRAASDLLGALREVTGQIGGSHAQRDLLQLTLRAARRRQRRAMPRVAA
jgi:hypothetical protein